MRAMDIQASSDSSVTGLSTQESSLTYFCILMQYLLIQIVRVERHALETMLTQIYQSKLVMLEYIYPDYHQHASCYVIVIVWCGSA